MQQKQFDEQLDGEEVMFVFRKHPVVMRKGLILGLLGPVIGVLPTAIWPQLGYGYFFGGLIGGVVLGFLLFFPSFISWYFSVIIVTDQRFVQVSRKGLFSKSIVDLSLNQIQSVNYEVRGLQETLLGYGTLLIQTYIGDLVLHNIERPARIYTQLLETLRDLGIDPVKLGADAQKEQPEDEES